MKFSRSFVTLAGLVSAQLAAGLPQASSSSVAPTPSATPGSFASTSGLQFTIDGKTGYFAGSNSYWIGFLTNDDDVDLVFSHMKESGLKILRVWGFNDVNEEPQDGTVWYQKHADGKSTINTGADGLQRLDVVVSSAEKHGIKLIINFVNFWDDYGGISAYLKAYGGGDDKANFYASDEMQAAYRTYVEAVVSRYSDSEAVFAWELANEPRCKGCNTTVLYDWIESTSKFIKSLDSEHMVCIGDAEGFGLDVQSDGSYPYQYSEGSDFAKNLAIETIDFGTFHLYPDSWGVSNPWGNGWVSSHGAACKAAGKPCLFEEYGVTSNHCALEKPWQNTALNTTAVSGDLYWQYGDQLSSGPSPDDGNTFYYGTDEFKCLVTDHIEAIGRL
ncbi:mannan endo-1,4-beta-mannosidase F [Aspergillus steynii IBT 23096]|uniref:mannan endo-1,4-beta-mannosidase n=1 Tax=Aspergillus steynii IBT 23096 TaxID=1392250 RepID=A0A2I2GFK8_9EURO|nr:mannan endo-1,4-beta-mannosidase F [Aspergillus steynii IBT 23096]PLB51664.1 mannan endo-1,4-beta-mannosidase F [Aspergillus steynii IBT 23096]